MTDERMQQITADIGEELKTFVEEAQKLTALAEITSQYLKSSDTYLIVDECTIVFGMMNDLHTEATQHFMTACRKYVECAKENKKSQEENND